MRVIQVARRSWLVIDDAFRPRFLIVYAAAVHQVTHETHILYRVDLWALDRRNRTPQRWVDTYVEAVGHCSAVLDTPDLVMPIREGYGSTVPPELQRRRWEQGLNPETGRPRSEEA